MSISRFVVRSKPPRPFPTTVDEESEAEWKTVHKLADGAVNDFYGAYYAIFKHQRDAIDPEQLAARLKKDGEHIGAIFDAEMWARDSVQLGLEYYAPLMRETAIALVPSLFETLGRLKFDERSDLRFDLRNEEAEKFIANSTYSGLMYTLGASETERIRDILHRGFATGQNVDQMAYEIRECIGADTAATDYFEKLANEYSSTMSVDKALTKATKVYERYQRARAMKIARTETIRAANGGQLVLWLKAQNKGLLPNYVRRLWIVTPDDKACPWCKTFSHKLAPLDSFAGWTAPTNQGFMTEGYGMQAGTVTYPPLHPYCRCAQGLAPDIDFASNVLNKLPPEVTSPPPSSPVNAQPQTVKTFGRGQEADRWFQQNTYNPMNLVSDIRHAVRQYTGSMAEDINWALRNDPSMTHHPQLRADVAALDKAFQPLPENVQVIRWDDSGVVDGMPPDVTVGKMFSDAAYMSSSVNPHFQWGGNYKLVMTLPKGTPAIYAEPVSQNRGEMELILPRNTRYVVTKVTEKSRSSYSTYWELEVTVVP